MIAGGSSRQWMAVVLALVLTAAGIRPVLAQDAADADQDAGQPSADVSPLEQLVTELQRLELRIDDVEENLAGASAAQAMLYEFQRRERWTEHHERLMQLRVAVEQAGDGGADSASVAFAAQANFANCVAAARRQKKQGRCPAASAVISSRKNSSVHVPGDMTAR